MKRVFKSIGAIILILVIGSVVTMLAGSGPSDTAEANLRTQTHYIHMVNPAGHQKLTYEKLTLSIPPGAVRKKVGISIEPVSAARLTKLNAGMVNTTPQQRGYRLGPKGQTFEKPISISVPYDPALIPAGMSEQDLRIWFHDESSPNWQMLPVQHVDEDQRIVVSETVHFTDFITATITVMDHPQAAKFTPTSIQDITVADPGANITLIEPPAANNLGDAVLHYPIDLPPGRQGMSPQLSVEYNSSAGNGWVGTGWDLSVGEVTIDTRWGVPRYDGLMETETYTLGGQMLTPMAHRGALQQRSSERVFHTRVEGEFRKIIRHGSTPKNYWWEVISKEGVRSFYGGDPDSNAPVSNCTLQDGSGNVFTWALREVRDLNGNSILYDYVRISDPGFVGSNVSGEELYLKSISYTGNGATPAPYTVTFVRDHELGLDRRSDVMVNARGGFKRVTAELLKRIEVKFNGELIRRYELNYIEGAFTKTLLTSITQYGEDGSAFYAHQFEYYDEIRDATGEYAGFAPRADWFPQSDNVGLLDITDLGGPGSASAISGASGFSVGGHAYIGFNPAAPTKAGSAGGRVGGSFNQSKGLLGLVDVNGDGLPDKLFRDGGPLGDFYYRLNQNGPSSNASTAFSEKRGPIANLSDISRESSTIVSGGLEIHPGPTGSTSVVFTTGSTYLTDVNADGLPDQVKNNDVLFGRVTEGGTVSFTSNSADTPVAIGSGAIDGEGIIEDYEDDYQNNIDMFPLHDTLRRWTAPFDGQVQVSGDVALILPEDPEETDDGVRVAIQHNSSELWSTRIHAGDAVPRTPTGVHSVAVQAGDRIYFRVQSILDGSNDQVSWDPEINYLGVPSVSDVNNLNPYRYRAGEDFVLGGRREICVFMPYNGTVRLEGSMIKHAPTTDDVTLKIMHRGIEISSQTLDSNEVGEIPVAFDFGVAEEDIVELRIRVDSPIDLSQIEWVPSLYYIDSPDTDVVNNDGDYMIQLHPPYDVDIYPANDLDEPAESWTVVETGSLTVSTGLMGHPVFADGDAIFTVKKQGELLAKRLIHVDGQFVDNVTIDLNVAQGDQLWFDYSTRDAELAEHLLSTDVDVIYKNELGIDVKVDVPATLHHTLRFDDPIVLGRGLFGQPYRGWAYAGYNGNRDRAQIPILENLLVVSNDEADYEVPEDREDQEFENPDAYPFCPFPEENYWRGPDEFGWIGPVQQSSSRYGLDQIDVPRPGQFAGGRGVKRLTRTFHTTVGLWILQSTFCLVPPVSRSVLDFMDMNGDRFPDIVGKNSIQYTTLDGGLEDKSRNVANLNPVRRSRSSSLTFGISGNPPKFVSDSLGRVTNGKVAGKGKETGNEMAVLGLTGGGGIGLSEVDQDLVDMNGDGLPDRVTTGDGSGCGHDDITVSLNLGYSFAEPECWGGNAADQSSAISSGMSLNLAIGAAFGIAGFNSPAKNYSNAGGLSLSFDHARINQMLVDINGDGLPDKVTPSRVVFDVPPDACPDEIEDIGDFIDSLPDELENPFDFGQYLRVAFNTGTGFAPEVVWTGADVPLEIVGFEFLPSNEVAVSDNVALGGGGYFTIGIGPLCVAGCYIIINPGADGSANMSRQRAALIDMNGDGFLDHVTSTEDSNMSVALNPINRTNLLKSVARPMGGAIDIEYSRSGNTPAHPESRWVMSRVEVFDGVPGDGVDTLLTTYEYENGYQDRLEREFYGYGRVIEQHRDINNDDALYRSIVREYRTDSYYTRGLLERVVLQDAVGNPYVEMENTYLVRDVETGNEPADPSSTMKTLFPQRVRTDQRFYEGSPVPAKSTYSTWQYDELGNVIAFFDSADIGAADDIGAQVHYEDCHDTYVMSAPNSILVTDSDGNVLRRREAAVDCSTGKTLQVREYFDDATAAVTDLVYTPNGNLERVTGPENLHGERYTLAYQYDPETQSHVTHVTDSLGYVSMQSHNLKYGEIASMTDLNGNVMGFEYDVFGRQFSITGPYEQGTNTPTIQFEYHPDSEVPWALSKHIDPAAVVSQANPPQNSAGQDTIDTVLFVDGTGRVLQTKQDATVHMGPDQPPTDVVIVSGATNYDFLGRPVDQYYPVTELPGTPGVYNTTYDSVTPAVTTYDVLDRTTHVRLPDNTSTAFAYDFGPDRAGTTMFQTTIMNANDVDQVVYRNVSKQIIGVKEFNDDGSEILWTSYNYNPTGGLIEIVDNANNVSTIGYDMLGRRTSIQHPDSGLLEIVYDPASNIIAKITPNLRPQGQQISYDYEFNRRTGIRYPNFPENNITYVYGPPEAADNRAGRVTIFSHESGSTERFYGKLGEVTREIRTIVPDTNGNNSPAPQVFDTQYVYDSWGRLLSLVYPDGEVLTYGYDSGGRVRKVKGRKGQWSYDYLTRLEYDKFGGRAYMEVGNGIKTTYTYRPDNRRLETLLSGQNLKKPFQNVNYTYDKVGNILQMNNDVLVGPPSDFGGPVRQNFNYDDLNRLVEARGEHEFKPNRLDRYDLVLHYDSIHNITHKDQLHEKVQPNGKSVPFQKTTYDWKYDYFGSQPHAATHIGERTFSYDNAGNQLGWDNDTDGTLRTVLWDEENRVQRIFDNGHEHTYKYDDAGIRVYKVGPQGETAYANQYFTMRNGSNGTKHVFIGETRLASKFVKPNTFEKDLFFYQSDHLGGANYITDIDGELYQHMQYFPFGETWIEESSNIQPTPYHFSGDEFDEDTGLYYISARYHDPRQGQFMGADPLWTGGLGAIDSKSLNVFVYARNNPLFFVDSSTGATGVSGAEGLLESVFGEFHSTSLGGTAAFAGVSAGPLVTTSGTTGNAGGINDATIKEVLQQAAHPIHESTDTLGKIRQFFSDSRTALRSGLNRKDENGTRPGGPIRVTFGSARDTRRAITEVESRGTFGSRSSASSTDSVGSRSSSPSIISNETFGSAGSSTSVGSLGSSASAGSFGSSASAGSVGSTTRERSLSLVTQRPSAKSEGFKP